MQEILTFPIHQVEDQSALWQFIVDDGSQQVVVVLINCIHANLNDLKHLFCVYSSSLHF